MHRLLASSLFLAVTACASDPGTAHDPSDPQDPGEDPMQPGEMGERGSLGLGLPSSEARIMRTATTSIGVTITRTEFEGDVTVTATDLPAGVTVTPLVIPANQSSGLLQLSGDASIALATYATATIRASAGSRESSAPIDLHLTDLPGALDTTFGATGMRMRPLHAGKDEEASAIAIGPDGSIYVAGVDVTSAKYFLAKFDGNGALVTTWAQGGSVMIPDISNTKQLAGIGVRADGVILVGAADAIASKVYAFTPTGAPLLSYGGNSTGFAEFSVAAIGQSMHMYVMKMLADGSVVVLGQSAASRSIIGRLLPNGTHDLSLDGDGIATLDFGTATDVGVALDVRPDGRIVVASFLPTAMPAKYKVAFAQLQPDGKYDTSFSQDGKVIFDFGATSAFVELATVLPDGRIAATGVRETEYVAFVVTAQGELDTTFAPSGYQYVVQYVYGPKAITPTAHGFALAGNRYVGSRVAVVELAMNGTPHTSFGTNGVVTADISPSQEDTGRAVAIDAEGRLVIAAKSESGTSELTDIGLVRMWP